MAHETHAETEPTTPTWLPVLGVVLSLVFGAWLALKPAAESAPAAAPSAAH
jgi:hypothetical protein